MSATSNRVVVYLQTQQNLNLLQQCFSNLTAINVSSFHFGFNPNGTPYTHLNDNVPTDPMFQAFWTDMAAARKNGVLVMAMVGGAGGAYTQLFNSYRVFYPILVATLKAYNFDGIDLDVEEQVTQANMQMLINDLRRDFPSNFYISSAPVAQALQTGTDPFSGVDWFALKSQIDWFNVQFYSGYGTLSTVNDYNEIIANGYAPQQILGGALTNRNDGNGYVEMSTLTTTLSTLSKQYPGQFGGTMGWEYYNANNMAEYSDPVGWAKIMKIAVG